MKSYKWVLKILIVMLAGCFMPGTQLLAQQSTNALYAQTSEMADGMIQYSADKASISRFYSTTSQADFFSRQQGNNYNSPERRKRLLELLDENLALLKRMPFEKWNINGKVDYVLFKRNLESEQYHLLEEQQTYSQVAKYLTFSDRLFALQVPRRRGIAVNGEEVAKELNDINKSIVKAIGSLKTVDSLELKQANLASDAAKGLQGALKDYFNFYNGYDPLFTWWVPKTYNETDSLLNAFATAIKRKGKINTLQKDDGSGIVGNPIGSTELVRQLKLEWIAYGPEDLVDIANKEFAWCDAELLKASREMGFGDNWAAALEKVKKTYVPPGKQPEAMYDLYKQSVDFLKKNDLLTLPPLSEEDWGMYMLSPERQRVSPFFLGGQSLLISYPTNTMTFDEKMMSMRGNNPNFSRATVHHELLAGHHLQGYMNDRHKVYRNFDTPFWTEGNALYWELLLWDMKFPRTPEEKIGMLFWRMHRCARIIFSLNYHLGKWTPQQCIDFLVDRVGHERANAEGEVRRSFTGAYGPLYQIAYMIGGLEFMALKRELVDTKKMTYKQYHDAILQENNMPVEMLRAILTNQNIDRDHKPSWKFYNKQGF
ncbi:MAG: DUF885 family protein [Ferruginibacter sp.]|nr:DUF885 family protein [Chitinophagaceae bacterium]